MIEVMRTKPLKIRCNERIKLAKSVLDAWKGACQATRISDLARIAKLDSGSADLEVREAYITERRALAALNKHEMEHRDCGG
jgi:hypothetical protein